MLCLPRKGFVYTMQLALSKPISSHLPVHLHLLFATQEVLCQLDCLTYSTFASIVMAGGSYRMKGKYLPLTLLVCRVLFSLVNDNADCQPGMI